MCLVLEFVPGLGGTQGPIIALPLSQVLGKDAGQVPLAALHREVLSSSYYIACTTTHALKTAVDRQDFDVQPLGEPPVPPLYSV